MPPLESNAMFAYPTHWLRAEWAGVPYRAYIVHCPDRKGGQWAVGIRWSRQAATTVRMRVHRLTVRLMQIGAIPTYRFYPPWKVSMGRMTFPIASKYRWYNTREDALYVLRVLEQRFGPPQNVTDRTLAACRASNGYDN